MDREEADLTPGEEWQQSLNATCNRLSTQYLNLLRAASGVSAMDPTGRQADPRGKVLPLDLGSLDCCYLHVG